MSVGSHGLCKNDNKRLQMQAIIFIININSRVETMANTYPVYERIDTNLKDRAEGIDRGQSNDQTGRI